MSKQADLCVPFETGFIQDGKGIKRQFLIISDYEKYSELVQVIKECEEKGTLYFNLDVSLPHKPRTTGEYSQNHLINGVIQEIAAATGDDFGYVKMYCKHKAISRGYPYKTSKLTGKVMPYSEADIDTVQAGYLIDTILEVVAFLGFVSKYDRKLREFINKSKLKV